MTTSAPSSPIAAQTTAKIIAEVEKAVVGKRPVLEMVLIGLFARGHVLIEDVPGVAKTLIARSLAASTGMSFSRIQFTPDLIPSDLTGSLLPDRSGTPSFVPGPLFANLVLGDEINRSPSKTQAAALEAMEEHQVTSDGVSHKLPNPFFLLATQNPIETEGTYPLPEAQLDRFLIRTTVGYPSPEAERDLLQRRITRGKDQPDLSPQVTVEQVLAIQEEVESIGVDPDVIDYATSIVEATRDHESLEIGASPRGSLALLRTARARAAINGRLFVTPDDIKAMTQPVLAHRVVLHTEAWVRGVKESDVIDECVRATQTPEALTQSDLSYAHDNHDS